MSQEEQPAYRDRGIDVQKFFFVQEFVHGRQVAKEHAATEGSSLRTETYCVVHLLFLATLFHLEIYAL